MRKINIFILLVSSLILNSQSLYAVGLGIAFPAGVGTTEYDSYVADSYEADASHFGINFVFDTNVAKRSVFNYRLNVGVEFFEHSYDYSYYDYWDDESYYFDGTHEGVRITTDHAFGFGIVRSSVVRLWMGPNVRFGFITGDYAGISLGAGVTILGLNFNMGPVFTLGLEAGYLFNADIYFDSRYFDGYTSSGWWDEDYSDAGVNNMFIAKLSILFRINDTYDDFF